MLAVRTPASTSVSVGAIPHFSVVSVVISAPCGQLGPAQHWNMLARLVESLDETLATLQQRAQTPAAAEGAVGTGALPGD